MEKINIAELLKDCPKGMELDCILFDNDVKVIFDGVDGINTCASIIKIVVIHDNNRISHALTKYGQWNPYKYAKCVIFPKGKTTWDEFTPPCKFKDGDIVATNTGNWIGITAGGISDEEIPTYCIIDPYNNLRTYFDKPKSWNFSRLATEEEKQKLLQAIKDNGYRWNTKTKTLEKLVGPKFKVGDIIHDVDYYKVQITEINEEEELYIYCSVIAKGIGAIPFEEQDNWKLVPNKFDINTLKPFDKVLVRDTCTQNWRASLFSHCNGFDSYKYKCINGCYTYCIPYEGNEHLLGKTDDYDKYYKN